MFNVEIFDRLEIVSVRAAAGDLLLDIIRKSGKPILAPCGGKGSCQKCRVEVDGVGAVLA